MKKNFFLVLVVSINLLSLSVASQTDNQSGALGLPGDNLDLYAVLDLFQKSKTIEDFEKSLNEEKTGINNLDLDNDKKVDFIKVETKKNGDDFTFILRVPISKTENQDVAVILVSKDNNKKITMQIVGDKDLYGENYVVEPNTTNTSSVTANPGYIGNDPVTANTPPTTTTTKVVVVESAPIVQYVYSPLYVPYYPPYYYGYYPPYFAAFSIMAVGIYRSNHYHYHAGGYGYHNTTVIVNTNNYNNYNNSHRNNSNHISHNNINTHNNINNRSLTPGTSDTNKLSAETRDMNRSSASNTKKSSNNTATRDNRSSASNTKKSSNNTATRDNRSSTARASTSNSMSSTRSNSSGYKSSGGSGGRRR